MQTFQLYRLAFSKFVLYFDLLFVLNCFFFLKRKGDVLYTVYQIALSKILTLAKTNKLEPTRCEFRIIISLTSKVQT